MKIEDQSNFYDYVRSRKVLGTMASISSALLEDQGTDAILFPIEKFQKDCHSKFLKQEFEDIVSFARERKRDLVVSVKLYVSILDKED